MKKNIVIINNTLGDGGAEKVLVDILNKFDYEKYNVKLVLIENSGSRFESLNNNVKLETIYPYLVFKNKFFQRVFNFYKYRSMKYFYNIIYKIKVGMKNDVEIAFLEGEPTRFVSKSLNKNSKKIAWVHTDLEKCRPSNINEQDRNIYKKFDEVVCVSNSSKNVFDKIYNDINVNSKVIYNFIDNNKINELANEKKELDFKNKTIIGIGRLTYIKRFDLLIKAHRKVIDIGINHDLVIVGEGEEKESLFNLAKELKVEKTVRFLGFKQNPYPYIKSADVFIMASEFEGFSLVIAEAASLNKAIISTDNGGGSELLNYGECGIIINRDDVDSLSKEIYSVLKDDKLRIKLENKSLQRSKDFDSDLIMEKIYDVINN